MRGLHIFGSSIPQSLKTKTFHRCIPPITSYGAKTCTLATSLTHKLKSRSACDDRGMFGVSQIDQLLMKSYVREPKWLTQLVKSVNLSGSGLNKFAEELMADIADLYQSCNYVKLNTEYNAARWTDGLRKVTSSIRMWAGEDRQSWRAQRETYAYTALDAYKLIKVVIAVDECSSTNQMYIMYSMCLNTRPDAKFQPDRSTFFESLF